jgi:DNA repair exonuclease SbcCD nuclease subunit
MIKCVIHTADIHFHNLIRHDEYSEQISKFIEKCKEISKQYQYDEVRILISGDLVSQKNNISNELIVIVSYVLRQLEQIAPVIVIAGNHDMLEGNKSRTDTLTGIFETAHFEHCTYLDRELSYQSGCVIDENVVWALYSIFDDFSVPNFDSVRENENTRVIGLYHGNIVGATLNNGTIMDNGLDGDKFGECDCVMAGHIHKRQTLERGDVKIVYPGSLIQQTFGETVSQHGFAVWNLEDMTYRFEDIESDYSLYDVEIENFDDIDNDKEKLINF